MSTIPGVGGIVDRSPGESRSIVSRDRRNFCVVWSSSTAIPSHTPAADGVGLPEQRRPRRLSPDRLRRPPETYDPVGDPQLTSSIHTTAFDLAFAQLINLSAR